MSVENTDETVAAEPVAGMPPPSPPIPPSPSEIHANLYEVGETDHVADFDSPEAPAPEAAQQPPAIPAPLAAAAAQSSTPPAAPKHSTRMVRKALALGLSQADIDGLTTDDLMDEVFDRQVSVERDPPAQPKQEPAKPAEEEIDLGLDESQYDPGLVKIMKSQARELKRLQGELQAGHRREAVRQHETTEEKIDATFAGLTDYEKVIGKGRLDDLGAESAQFSKRLAIYNEARRLAGPKGTLPQLLAKIPTAAKNLYGELIAPPAPPATPAPDPVLEDRKKTWNSGGLARPTHREPVREKGEKKAMQTAARVIKDMGLDDDDSELDAFLE